MLKVTFNMISLQYLINLYLCHTNEKPKFSDKSTASTSRQDEEEEATDSLEPEGKVLVILIF